MTTTTLFGFGSNYYRAMGGTLPTRLSHEERHDVRAVSCKTRDLLDGNNHNDEIVQVACTSTATIFVTACGKVHQVGTMHGAIYKAPLLLPIELPLKVMDVAAGRHFCVGRMEGGLAAVSWGAGHFGQLGHGPNVCSLRKPRVMEHLLPHNTGSPLVQIAVGSWHGMALTKSGTIFAWGSNRRWQCGIRRNTNNNKDGSNNNSSSSTPPTLVYPQPIPVQGHVKFTKICCGKAHSLALATGGKVYSWGASHVGQCGHSTRRATIAPPRQVEALAKVVIVEIAAGDAHSLALTGGGRVFGWGSGLEGQLGLGPAVPLSRPKLVDDLDFVAICAGQEWKLQQLQQQGNKQLSSYNASPMTDKPIVGDPGDDDDVPMLPAFCASGQEEAATNNNSHQLSTVPKIVKVEAAGSYSIATSSSGHIYAWGYNDVGVLGLPRPTDALPFVEPYTVNSSLEANNNNATASSGRLLEVETFDSRHNVLLPRRVDALADYTVKQVAGGPSHMWCLCEPRTTDNDVVVGRTLYEVQEEKRARGMKRLKQNIVATTTTTTPYEQQQEKPMVIKNNGGNNIDKKSAGRVDSEEEDENDDTDDPTTKRNGNGDDSHKFVTAAQAAPPSKDKSSHRRITRLLHRLSTKSSSKHDSSIHENEEEEAAANRKKGGKKARQVLSQVFCKSER